MTWAAPWCSPIEAATWLPNLLARVRMMPAQIETIANGMVSFSTLGRPLRSHAQRLIT